MPCSDGEKKDGEKKDGGKKEGVPPEVTPTEKDVDTERADQASGPGVDQDATSDETVVNEADVSDESGQSGESGESGEREKGILKG